MTGTTKVSIIEEASDHCQSIMAMIDGKCKCVSVFASAVYRLHCHSIVGCESPPVDCLLGDWGACFWSEISHTTFKQCVLFIVKNKKNTEMGLGYVNMGVEMCSIRNENDYVKGGK